MFALDGFYTDVPIDDGGATGPAQIAARLRIGFEPVQSFDHAIERIVVEGDTVITEHAETWHFDDETRSTLPFVSVQVVRDGLLRAVAGLLQHGHPAVGRARVVDRPHHEPTPAGRAGGAGTPRPSTPSGA